MTRKQLVPLVLVAAVVAAVAWFLLHRPAAADTGLVSSGTVEATDAALGFQVPGRIARVLVHEGDRVHAGDTLAVLDRTELDARRAQARAALGAVRAQLDQMHNGARPEEIAQARSADSAADARWHDADRDRDRTATLRTGGAVSQEALDKAQLALDVARSTAQQARQQLELMLAGTRRETVAAQQSAVAQAEAAVSQADAVLDETVILAPFDGAVTIRNREPGETVTGGSPVVTIANLGDRWVRIYLSEVHLGEIHLGDTATITTDAPGNRQYRGAISFIATEAEFTPRNVQTAEERVKLVYAVKVRVVDDSANDLKPGMPADVTLKLASTAAARR
jgi:HlyD family secretion protein